MTVIETLETFIEEGKLKRLDFPKFTFQELEDAILEKGDDAYQLLGYKQAAGLIALLDRNIDYKRKRGEKWADILQGTTSVKTIMGIGVDDVDHTDETNKKYVAAYRRLIKKGDMCEDWISSLSAFKDWYMSNYTEGSRMVITKTPIGPDSLVFVGGEDGV